MTSDDAGGKSPPASSGPVLGQENRQEHQREGSGPKAREDTNVSGQAAMGHDANGPTAGSEQAGNQAHRGQREQHDRPLRDWGSIVAIANVVLAFVGIGGLFFTAFQLGAMRDQLAQNVRQANAAESANRIASEALSSADRAWLNVTPQFTGNLQPGQGFDIVVQVNNSGRTPALTVRYDFTLDLADNYERLGSRQPQKVYKSGVVFPNAYVGAKLGAHGVQITKEMIDDINSNAKRLYLRGEVRYQDINIKEHFTTYCSFYEMSAGGFVPCEDENANYAN